MPDSRLFSYAGPEHCDWQNVVFSKIGYRSGLTQPGLSGELNFLRDPTGELADHAVARFEPSAELPANAVDTGWQRDGQELWLDADGAAAYLQIDDEDFERWPRTRGVIGCG